MMFKIVNVKVSLKTSTIFLDNVCEIARKKNLYCKNYKNFIVLKSKYTYIIFKVNKEGKNHVNITKIPLIHNISDAVEYFKDKIIDCTTENISIDNISATASAKTRLNLQKIVLKKDYKNLDNFLALKYNNQLFPGLFLKFQTGTVIVFHSGKCVIVGCKDETSIRCLTQNICALTEMK